MVDVARDFVVRIRDFSVQFLVGLPAVRELTAQNREKKHAQSPNVCGRPTILRLVDNLWRHVAGRATEDLDFLVVGDAG